MVYHRCKKDYDRGPEYQLYHEQYQCTDFDGRHISHYQSEEIQ